jgi:hypothetical protein
VRPSVRRAAAALPLLCSGCLTHGLVDWATAPAPLTSQVTQVEVSKVPSSRVFGVSAVDVAEDGSVRRRDLWWVPGAPATARDEIARVASLTTASVWIHGHTTLVALHHRLPLVPARVAVPVVSPDAPLTSAQTVVLRDDHLELWRGAERVDSVDLLVWPTRERPPGLLRRLALGLGVPFTVVLDVATSPIQVVVAVVVFAAHGGHVH